MKTFLFKRYALAMLGTAAGLMPVAIVVACHKTGVVDLVEVDLNADNLNEIVVTGNTKGVSFSIPQQLTNVDDSNTLDADAKTKAFDILISASIKVGESPLAINNNYMPPELLQAYLNGNLFWKSNVLTMKSGGADLSVQKQYGGLFGFNIQKVNAINNATKVGEWTTSLKAKYQPVGLFTASKDELDKVVVLDTSALKTYVTIDTSFVNDAATIATWSSKFDYQTTSSNDNVRWTSGGIKVADLPSNLAKYVTGLQYLDPTPTSRSFGSATSLPTTFNADPKERSLLIGLIPNSKYVLSKDTIDITSIAKVRDISINIDSQPGFADADLSSIIFRADGGSLVIDESAATLPFGTVAKYQIGSGGEYFAADDFPAFIKNQQSIAFSDVNVHLEPLDVNKYKLIDDKKTKPDVSAVQGFVNTSVFFSSLSALKVDVVASTPSAIVWLGAPTVSADVLVAASRLEYLAGDYAIEALARAATDWSSALPKQTRSTWRDYNLWARLLPKSGYVLSETYANLSATSLLNKVIPDTNISALLSVANTISADIASSLHNNVRWNRGVTIPIALSSAVGSVEFATGELTAANVLASAKWTTALPTSVDYDSTKRTLWMRITPQTGYKFEKSLYDLTATSKIRDVLSLVDADPKFKDVNLAQITISGPVESAVITEPTSQLPEGVRIVYSLTSSGALSKAHFISYLATNSGTLNGSDLTKIQVALEVKDAAKYKLTNTKTATPITTDLKIVTSSLPNDLLTLLTSIKANVATSTHESVKWDGVPTLATLPASVGSLSYLSDEISTTKELASKVLTGWTVNLPNVVSADHSKRNVWVKITPASGYSFADPYLSLTSSSDVRKVRTRLDTSSIDLTQVTISGDYNALSQSNNGVVVPSGAVMTFKFKDGVYGIFESLQTQITGAPSLSAADIDTIRVHLQPSSALFELSSDVAAKPIVSGIRTTLAAPTEFTTMASAIRVSAASTHDALSFDPVAWVKPATIASVSYALGNYASAAAVAASSVVWADNLSQLTSTSFDHSTRYLWARINPASGASFEQTLFDISSSSGIRAVKSKVDTLPSYALADLSKIQLSGAYNNLTFTTSAVTVPEGAQLVYQFNGGSWVSESQVKAQISTATPINITLINTIKAQLAPLSALYTVISPRTAAVDVSRVTISLTVPAEVTTYLQSIVVDTASSTHINVAWPTLATLPTTLQGISFVSGNYSSKESVAALASSAWQTTLPSTTAYQHTSRKLWAKLTPAAGYQFDEVYYDITTSSKIRDVKSRVDNLSGYGLINLSNITLSGYYKKLTITTPNITVPEGAKLIYQYDGGSWGTEAQLKTTLSALSTMTAPLLGTIKVKFDSLSTLFVISDSRIATPNVSGVLFNVIEAQVPSTFMTMLNAIRVTSNSTRDSLYFGTVVWSKPDTMASVSYALGNYATIEEASASSVVWVQDLWEIESTTLEPNARYLWARIDPADGYYFGQTLFDITVSSGLRNVK